VTTPSGLTYTLIKPFSATVDGNGHAVITISHSLQGIAWQIPQVGLSLGQMATSPEVAAAINGIPFVSSVVLGTSVFASLPGTGVPPIAMTTQFSGLPYPTLEAGDQFVIGVIGAAPGDTFTAGAYINEIPSPAQAAAASSNNSAYIARAGTQRWS